MARKRKGRDISGILLLDKPHGLSSNAALQKVKHLFDASKAGHTGSLDPLATGMLPICLGEATKVSSFLLDADKRYQVTCQLGIKTTTGDAEGDVIETRSVPELSANQLESVLDRFRGTIEQIPPMYSALKHKGERLYNLARQGLEVEREVRTVRIHELSLIAIQGQDRLDFEVRCSKGTYVRTLIEDIGEALGCGAHVTALRRLAVGPFQDPAGMVTLERLQELKEISLESLDALLLPIEQALMQWPEVRLNRDTAYYLLQGQSIQVSRAPTEGWVRLYDAADQLLGMGLVQDDGKVAPKRLFRVKKHVMTGQGKAG